MNEKYVNNIRRGMFSLFFLPYTTFVLKLLKDYLSFLIENLNCHILFKLKDLIIIYHGTLRWGRFCQLILCLMASLPLSYNGDNLFRLLLHLLIFDDI